MRELQNGTITEGNKTSPAGENGEGRNHVHAVGVYMGAGGKLLKAFYEIVMVMYGNSKNTRVLS